MVFQQFEGRPTKHPPGLSQPMVKLFLFILIASLLRGAINSKRRIRNDSDYALLLQEMNNVSFGQKLVESHGTSSFKLN